MCIKRDVVKRHLQTPKSRRSKRLIRVPKDLLDELKRRSRHALLRPEVEIEDQHGNLHKGHPFSLNQHSQLHKHLPDSLKKPIQGATAKAGIRTITHRDLRHTFASHLRLRGIPLEDIRDLLGHHSIQMTMRYAHISADRFDVAARELEKMMTQ